jgi:hypothetical protein
MNRSNRLLTIFLMLWALLPSSPAQADEQHEAIQRCLSAWGKHPFGSNPPYRVMAASVKIFGIGDDMVDRETTRTPALVLVDAGVNIMGGSTIELLNPKGWYCLRSNVNVMGGMTIRAHCKAHLASAVEGVTVLGSNADNKAVTVMGKTRVELTGCQ